ncbi:MAG: YiiX/YebB-like N1pC/P60 family cysteine hydrolase [Candidatus Azotimanducaceae bacterium]
MSRQPQIGGHRKRQIFSDFDSMTHEVKPCDVILVEGRTRISEGIRFLTNSAWTHACLYIGRTYDIQDQTVRKIVSDKYMGEPDDQLIIESVIGEGTIIRSLDTYRDEHMRICRPSKLSFRDMPKVIRHAAEQIGKDYNVRQIFDLARFLLPWYILPKKWASSLFKKNSSRSTKTVCSTMIAESFASAGYPILPLLKHSEAGIPQLFRRNPKLCTPSDFDFSPYFDVIKYSFVDFYQADYELFPWSSDSLLESEENDFFIDPKDA